MAGICLLVLELPVCGQSSKACLILKHHCWKEKKEEVKKEEWLSMPTGPTFNSWWVGILTHIKKWNPLIRPWVDRFENPWYTIKRELDSWIVDVWGLVCVRRGIGKKGSFVCFFFFTKKGIALCLFAVAWKFEKQKLIVDVVLLLPRRAVAIKFHGGGRTWNFTENCKFHRGFPHSTEVHKQTLIVECLFFSFVVQKHELDRSGKIVSDVSGEYVRRCYTSRRSQELWIKWRYFLPIIL